MAEYQSCRDQVDPFQEDLKTVDSRLRFGITQSTFSELVGAASISHDDLDGAALVDIAQGDCTVTRRSNPGLNDVRRCRPRTCPAVTGDSHGV